MIKYSVYSTLYVFMWLVCSSTFAHSTTIKQAILKFGENLDPVYSVTSESSTIAKNLFETLVIIGEDGDLIPGQAESWSVSEDQKTYTFHLYPNLKWSDGYPLTAHDFVLAFRRFVDPKINRHLKLSYLTSFIKNAQEISEGKLPIEDLQVKAEDNSTLIIKLEYPVSFFLEILNYGGFSPVPSHRIKAVGQEWAEETPLVSNGIFMLKERSDNQLNLVKNPFSRRQVDFSNLEISLYEDKIEAFNDFIEGKLDLVEDLPAKQREWLKNQYNERHVEEILSGTTHLTFNVKNQVLESDQVRKALSLAIDRTYMVKLLGYSSNQIAHTLSPVNLLDKDNPFYSPHANLSLDERAKLARQILEQVGYDHENKLKVELIHEHSYEIDKIAALIRSMWHAIGVETELKPMQKGDLIGKVLSGEFQINILTWFGDYKDASSFYSILDSQSSYSPTQWKSEKFEELLAASRSQLDQAKRQELYRELEHIISESNPILPLFYPATQYLISEKISHIKLDGAVNVIADNIWLKNKH